ncbi:Leucine-, isoleucine-, valine-, threonine-, and alanine-binding protein precursor [Tritonibacter multivorans]|uniref:Leucine-, isoleucine-, valine-, threonine-, and alanine-binding protein n=1 Tax=Tritonibacter multivorans TaxID=928856 RepID=A0A0N7LZR3_9RHOB|nr:ABC transporter substrate-binding protein [Tritonibacter multivorans]MDA7422140.1 ABC transporter substrate-binding protein [Tritonibacter multivorans]CUH78385.1 Leucine-, isoleucine-, valine-, threonine-, and alanine-binding protein precursor [Tritonibacter multivorans]SFD16123.1 amino acid/amide ABC transporter substrate-binding protein, HAAT family [Tritonibacter multivorans]
MKTSFKVISTVLATALSASVAMAETKVGMITTLSGGGAGLGIDVRDGFMLAISQSGRDDIEVVIEDDQRKPDVAVQLADKMVQSEKVDVLTGIIWSNLAMAVVPSVTAQGKFYLSPNAGPSQLAGRGCNQNYFNVAWQNDNLHEGAGAYANGAGYQKTFILAPNYPAGKDALTGYKRFFKGDLAGELYTKLGQTDYAAEIAQIRASGADSVFFFLPGGMGIAFLKQYADSGVDLPVVGPAFSFDQGILQAVGDAALGVVNTSQWNKDIENPTNAAFVESFAAEYGRLPSLYASQGFDTANLLISALEKADVSDADAFRAALKAAEFDSTRGDFAFGNNHHPVQTIYAREVIKEGDVFTNKVIGVALENHADAYAAECKM